jgi:hypothetical protein
LSLSYRGRGLTAALAAAALVALAPAGPVRAHGDDPRIEVDAQRLAPGGPLTVRGYDFAYETDVELSLVAERQQTHLASVTTDVEGAFIHTVALPADVFDGAYVVEAQSAEHLLSGPPMFISGAPITPGDKGTLFEEGDSLLAPMPTMPARAGASPVERLAASPADDGSSVATVGIIVIGGLIVVAWSASAVERRRRAQRRQRSLV